MYIWFVEYLLILFLSRILIWLKNYVSWNKLELLIINSLNIFSPPPSQLHITTQAQRSFHDDY